MSFPRWLSLLPVLALSLSAQNQLPDAPGMGSRTSPPPSASATKVLPGSRPVPPALRPYISCKLPLGPELVQYASLPQVPLTRPALTLTGPKEIKLEDGLMSAYAFPGSAPFANVKAELLPTANYKTEKADVISEFDAIHAAGDDTVRNPALKPTLNGFEIYGFDRKALDGNVLGIYLFFDNTHRVATTAYFLNAPEAQRKFATVSAYDNLRDGFLNAYTVCVRKQLSGTTPAKSAAAKRTVKTIVRR